MKNKPDLYTPGGEGLEYKKGGGARRLASHAQIGLP